MYIMSKRSHERASDKEGPSNVKYTHYERSSSSEHSDLFNLGTVWWKTKNYCTVCTLEKDELLAVAYSCFIMLQRILCESLLPQSGQACIELIIIISEFLNTCISLKFGSYLCSAHMSEKEKIGAELLGLVSDVCLDHKTMRIAKMGSETEKHGVYPEDFPPEKARIAVLNLEDYGPATISWIQEQAVREMITSITKEPERHLMTKRNSDAWLLRVGTSKEFYQISSAGLGSLFIKLERLKKGGFKPFFEKLIARTSQPAKVQRMTQRLLDVFGRGFRPARQREGVDTLLNQLKKMGKGHYDTKQGHIALQAIWAACTTEAERPAVRREGPQIPVVTVQTEVFTVFTKKLTELEINSAVMLQEMKKMKEDMQKLTAVNEKLTEKTEEMMKILTSKSTTTSTPIYSPAATPTGQAAGINQLNSSLEFINTPPNWPIDWARNEDNSLQSLLTSRDDYQRSAVANDNDGQAERGPPPQTAMTDNQMIPEAANGDPGRSTPLSTPPPQ